MNIINLKKYGVAITQKEIALKIYHAIKAMNPSNNVVVH